MISSIRGVLESIGPGRVTVDIGPMSMQVSAPTSTISVLGGMGERVHLHTYLYLQQESLALYGFATIEERDMFITLLGVTGIGPKLGLALLSAMSPRALARAITSSDTATLTQVSGLGQKTAGRLVLELKGKLEREWGREAVAPTQDLDDVVAALSALGYAPSEARAAISGAGLDPKAPLEEQVRRVLQGLGAR